MAESRGQYFPLKSHTHCANRSEDVECPKLKLGRMSLETKDFSGTCTRIQKGSSTNNTITQGRPATRFTYFCHFFAS
jgi:hypothetical protein